MRKFTKIVLATGAVVTGVAAIAALAITGICLLYGEIDDEEDMDYDNDGYNPHYIHLGHGQFQREPASKPQTAEEAPDGGNNTEKEDESADQDDNPD